MDSLAVSLTSGSMQCVSYKKGIKIAVVFALFQAIMPVLGWLVGITFKDSIEQIDHWIAFSILFIIGFLLLLPTVLMQLNGF